MTVETSAYVDDMTAGYVECALWAGLDWDGQEGGNPRPLDANYGPDDLAPETVATIRAQCEDFHNANRDDLAAIDAGQAGHDFHLTRNHHGAGFWDRGLGAIGDRLTSAAHAWGESDLYVGDDGKLYV